MSEPAWVTVDDVVALNKQVVALGPHDEPHVVTLPGALESAVNRPQQHYHWAEDGTGDDLVLLGSKLCIGISESQAFLQGNKRTGVVAMEMFFNLNGYTISTAAAHTLAEALLKAAHPDKSQRLDDEGFAAAIDLFVVDAGGIVHEGLPTILQGVSFALGNTYGVTGDSISIGSDIEWRNLGGTILYGEVKPTKKP